ncbi:MAG: hypothetical protein D6788_10790 [Planctomycetota bacterium]|nr:MAG: hypothetical protein D6788_10790 [Planctomycetota bacterium]
MSSRSPSPVDRRFWIGYWVLLFLITHVPVPAQAGLPLRGGDKVIHFVGYALLAYLGGRACGSENAKRRRRVLIAWAGVYLAYGALDEWLQSFVGRTASAGDWLADAAGVVLCTLWLVGRRSSSGNPRLLRSRSREV